MKTLLKIFGGILLLLVIAVAGLLIYVKKALPDVGAPEDIKVEATPKRVERGKYLANHVAVCIDCHSTRDWSYFSGPIIPGTEGKGGEVFDRKFGFPGSFISHNITPAGVGDWTDGELFRAITAGVSRDGTPLFPIMQYPAYGKSDKEDIYSIIAYMRTLKPIERKNEESKPDFPMNFIIHTIPQKPAFALKPDPSNTVAYGKYTATMAACIECHTQQIKGQKIEGMELAGGFKFAMPGMDIFSRNITPDLETGIGNWSKTAFIGRFKAYADSSYIRQKLGEGQFNSPMPWTMYAGMTIEDLGAIYDYLRTVPPIQYVPPKHVIY